jgi:hypothetical protein
MEESGQLQAPAALPSEEIAHDRRLDGPQTLWRNEKSCHYRNSTPAVQLVAIPTEVSRLLKVVIIIIIAYNNNDN